MRYLWDEAKLQSNLAKHGLDFADADLVLDSPLKLEIDSVRHGDRRRQAFAYVFDLLAVLTVVYVPGEPPRIVSFRHAARSERTAYHDWLENDFNDDG